MTSAANLGWRGEGGGWSTQRFSSVAKVVFGAHRESESLDAGPRYPMGLGERRNSYSGDAAAAVYDAAAKTIQKHLKGQKVRAKGAALATPQSWSGPCFLERHADAELERRGRRL